MYIPAHFEETSVETMHSLMRAHPLATLVTSGASGITANHIPFHLAAEPLPFGVLRGHVARANPMLDDLAQGGEMLAVFQGVDSYISPSWYATKQAHGKAVPTWNYVAVHAYGELRVMENPHWLLAQLDALTAEHEGKLAEPWSIAEAPPEFIERLMQSIVGIEMVITRLQGKWKTSQNQPAENRNSVVRGLCASGQQNAVAMADLIRGKKHD